MKTAHPLWVRLNCFTRKKAKKKSFALAKDFFFFWQGRRDSNSQHPVLETGALPIELRP